MSQESISTAQYEQVVPQDKLFLKLLDCVNKLYYTSNVQIIDNETRLLALLTVNQTDSSVCQARDKSVAIQNQNQVCINENVDSEDAWRQKIRPSQTLRNFEDGYMIQESQKPKTIWSNRVQEQQKMCNMQTCQRSEYELQQQHQHIQTEVGDNLKGRLNWSEGDRSLSFRKAVSESGGLWDTTPAKILYHLHQWGCTDITYDNVKSKLQAERNRIRNSNGFTVVDFS
eukprot:TRINITY_DN5684_c0_g1_i1.p1 TRINITY_DN5684_c0_g1~~TRINITY_DN5684_c0_g1_i1.p1  ORF type:complete len:228 (-),score=20.45 TRINITY_DN5684_c0_g1_i1:212-895(-)